MRLTLKLLSSALLAMLMSACSDSSDPVDPSAPSDTAMAYLTINVSAGSPKDSRANDIPADGNYTNTFEDGIAPYEQIYTLRAIIVRPDDTIEHNELLHTAASGQGFNQYTYASLKVVAGEKKTVYLFANEDYTNILENNSSTKSLVTKLNGLKIGEEFPKSEFEQMVIQFQDGKENEPPMIDNTNSRKSYLPMSEVFDVNIEAVNNDGTNLYQSADLFITRAAVKFGFAIDNSSVVKGNVKITEVTIHGLADREYLLPNNTTYSPAKYDEDEKTSGDNRIITSYVCPNDVNASYYYTFTMPADFGITYNDDGSQTIPGTYTYDKEGNQKSFYSPALYFAESPVPADGKFTVDVTAAFDTGIPDSDGNPQYVTSTFEGIELNNLPNLPRNTFVKIIIKLGETQPELEAIVQPYTGVWLNPDFGIDRP